MEKFNWMLCSTCGHLHSDIFLAERKRGQRKRSCRLDCCLIDSKPAKVKRCDGECFGDGVLKEFSKHNDRYAVLCSRCRGLGVVPDV